MKNLKEKFKKLEDKKKLLAVFGILATVLITLSATYAFFSYARNGRTENSVESGVIKFIYNESSRVGNGISLTDAMPMPDANGKIEEKYFDFSVTGTSGTSKIAYEITARKTDSSDNIDDSVKVYLTKVDGNNETQKVLSIYDDLTQSTNALAANHTEKTLYTGAIPAGSTNYTENFRLRMWLNNDTNDGNVLPYEQTETGSCSDSTYTTEADCVAAKKDWTRVATPMAEKEFTVKVNVYANGQAATAQEIADSNSVGILSVKVNNKNAIVNEDETQNCDFYVEVDDSVTEAEIDIGEKVEGQTFTVESITENEANTITGASTKITVPVGNGTNYYKITTVSKNKNNTDVYVLKIRKVLSFSKIILRNNTLITAAPHLNTTSNAGGDANGLYSMNVTNGFGGKNGTSYYFRGNVTNNYVSFAGKTWRIVRINEDGTVRIILTSNIPAVMDFSSSRNGVNYMYYTNGTAKANIESWYSTNITGANDAMVASGNYFCESARVKVSSGCTGGNANMTFRSDYTPDLKCNTDGNGKGLVSGKVGLLNYDEVILAGGSPDKQSDYYLKRDNCSFTMSPAGFVYNEANIWYFSSNVWWIYPSGGNCVTQHVINLRADVTASGTGTSGDPYIVHE